MLGERQNKTFELFVNKLVISSQSVSAEKIKLQNATLTLIKKCTFPFRLYVIKDLYFLVRSFNKVSGSLL